jgi:hypothetical protein
MNKDKVTSSILPVIEEEEFLQLDENLIRNTSQSFCIDQIFSWTQLKDYSYNNAVVTVSLQDLKSTYINAAANPLTLFYNTKNDRLVFGLNVKVLSSTLTPQTAKLHLVKRQEGKIGLVYFLKARFCVELCPHP